MLDRGERVHGAVSFGATDRRKRSRQIKDGWHTRTCEYCQAAFRSPKTTPRFCCPECRTDWFKEHQILTYYADTMRHLVCIPYSVKNLHRMAAELSLHRCWYHHAASYPHYDIPKRRVYEILAKATVVSPREILSICKGTYESH